MLNNVETFCAVPAIILQRRRSGSRDLGTPKNGGTRLFCLSGHVNKPGVYELPMGFNLMRMIEEVGGGIRGGKKLKAVIPGGSSCPVLKAEECDVADGLRLARQGEEHAGVGRRDRDGRRHRHGASVALRIMKFYQHESCGWCIPCREGTTWLKKMLTRFDEGSGTCERYRPDR